MKRYPDGWQGGHFFQKDAPKHMPEWIPRVPLPSVSRATREPRTIAYPLVNDELALLWMASMGCIAPTSRMAGSAVSRPLGLGGGLSPRVYRRP